MAIVCSFANCATTRLAKLREARGGVNSPAFCLHNPGQDCAQAGNLHEKNDRASALFFYVPAFRLDRKTEEKHHRLESSSAP